MTNIKEKTNKNDMHLHIEKAFELIEEHLPNTYVKEVLEKTGDNKEITASLIRNVRVRKSPSNKASHLIVINAMVEVANDYKKQKEKLMENISQ